MGISLEHLPAGGTLAALKEKIRSKERSGFELITLARGQLQGQPTNLATFREREDDADPGDIHLVRIPGSGARETQETELDDGEDGGKRLISYAGVLVLNDEANVAVFRV
jgi:hypothetical protein